MSRLFSSISPATPLSDAQLRFYASETGENFRWVSKLVASRSPYTLTSSDLTSVELQHELSELGQFAEIAHGHLSPDFIWRNMTLLCQPDFPLHGYDALHGSSLISIFRGLVAGLQGYIALREPTKQLIVAFSGTSAAVQALYNLDFRLKKYPGGDGCAIHAGFWKMYNGVRSLALEALAKALREHAVDEIVLTGHSLGAVMCYLFTLEIITGDGEDRPASSRLYTHLPLKLAVFGCPRFGNLALSEHWQNMVAVYCTREGKPSVSEYSVKALNDGQALHRLLLNVLSSLFNPQEFPLFLPNVSVIAILQETLSTSLMGVSIVFLRPFLSTQFSESMIRSKKMLGYTSQIIPEVVISTIVAEIWINLSGGWTRLI